MGNMYCHVYQQFTALDPINKMKSKTPNILETAVTLMWFGLVISVVVVLPVYLVYTSIRDDNIRLANLNAKITLQLQQRHDNPTDQIKQTDIKVRALLPDGRRVLMIELSTEASIAKQDPKYNHWLYWVEGQPTVSSNRTITEPSGKYTADRVEVETFNENLLTSPKNK